jgi:phosphate-selective porin OprO/OprP
MVILRNKRRTLLLGGALALMGTPALAQTDPRYDRLQQELSDLRTQLSDLRHAQGNLDNSAALADLKRSTGDQYVDLAGQIGALPKVGLDNGRLTVASANGDFTFALRSLIQYDIGYFAQGRNGAVPDLSSGTNFRRAQIGFTGTAFRDWAYNLTFDFAGNGIEKSGYIYNAYLEYDGL